jgi:uncharacterized protein (DUF362 family)
MNDTSEVFIMKIDSYDSEMIKNSLPHQLFDIINPGDNIVIKPNWVLESHSDKPDEWDYVISHPMLIDAVIQIVIKKLKKSGSIILTDGPELNADFNKILNHYPIAKWREETKSEGINFEIIDLRDVLYIQDKNVTVHKITLNSDPNGKVLYNLRAELSEFYGHIKSKAGYFGGGSDFNKTNNSHNGVDNVYSISKTAIQADVFINLPKLKTHKKSGITASLKNLVGINTDRSFLPHHTIGTLDEHGDQFPNKNVSSRLEKSIMPIIHQKILTVPIFARMISPFLTVAKLVFGDNSRTVRAGAWYGNDTLWRTIIDINKILFYGNTDGTLRPDDPVNMKKYITLVDGIYAGEGMGPKTPDKIELRCLIAGKNPVAVDYISAKLMGFDPRKIPSIINNFNVKNYRLCHFTPEQIRINHNNSMYNLDALPEELIINFKPHFGWKNHIELRKY